MYGALGALGVDAAARWSVLDRIALDCAPAIRVPLMWALLAAAEPARTSDLAQAAGLVTKTAGRQLDEVSVASVARASLRSCRPQAAPRLRLSRSRVTTALRTTERAAND